MKKITLLFLFIVLFSSIGMTQGISINQTNTPPDVTAMLDVSSTSKGVLIPRMRSNERLAISSPANGLIVYDVDTRSVWYNDINTWKEILNSSSTITPTGSAFGDLYGNYPSPNVGKIQNLDVAFGVPFDKQVMKWDMLNNRWQGLNDSLFLPYNVVFGSPTKLFGITNSNTTNGATAVYGKSGAGSGMLPSLTIGVWGDNANGAGALGTSTNGTGVYGYSVNNFGVYGYTAGINYAGLYGANANTGYGVIGEIFNGGTALFAKSNGSTGKAGYFRNYHASNNDTALAVIQDGLGKAFSISATNASQNFGVMSINNAGVGQIITLTNSNTANNAHMLFANQVGTGTGFYISVANTLNTHPGVVVEHAGTGTGIESYGYKGKAGFFQVPAATNASAALAASTLGTGNAGSFTISNASNSTPALDITTNGTGRGLEVSISNASSLAAALHASSSGNKGIEGLAQVNGVIGQSTGLTGGIGVLGQSSLNSDDGVGVKGISYSSAANNTSAALIGINNADGTAVYADATGGGTAVWGRASRINGASIYASNDASQGQALRGNATGTDGISLYAESGNAASQSIAGYFRNNYALNSRNVVQIVTNGTGKGLSIQNTNSSNNNEMLRIQNSGTAEFLLCLDGSLNNIVSIAKDGDIVTDGTLTVKGNRGIVRNSSSTQLRTEILTITVPASDLTHYDEFNSSIDVVVTFGTAFSSAPIVMMGNVTSGSIKGLTPTIVSVSSTGFTFRLWNFTPYDFSINSTSIKFMAVGAE